MISAAYPPAAGGVATHVANLAQGLLRASHDISVDVITTTRDAVPKHYSNGRLVVWKLPVKNVPNFYGRRAPYEDTVLFAMDKWHEMEPDLIHAHDLDSVQIGSMLKASFRKPLVATIHRVPKAWKPGRYAEEPKDCYMEAIRVFKLADAIVVPSKASREILLQQGFPKRMITVIRHGIMARYLASFSNDSATIERLELGDSGELVLCPVRADPHKDPSTFVRAAALLKNSLGNRRLLFVVTCDSSDPDYTTLLSIARNSGLELNKDIVFQCFTWGQMPTLYRRAKVCVVPSRRESFGQTVLEAFVFRTPVVAANTTGLKEIVRHGENGLLFTDGDYEDLAKQIRAVLERPGLADKLRGNGLEEVMRRYNAERMVARYRRFFRSVLRRDK